MFPQLKFRVSEITQKLDGSSLVVMLNHNSNSKVSCINLSIDQKKQHPFVMGMDYKVAITPDTGFPDDEGDAQVSSS